MSFKTRVIVLGSLAATLLAALVLGKLLSPLRMGAISSEARLLQEFSPAAVRTVTLSDSGSTVRLTRSAGWTLDMDGSQYPASSSKIDTLLQELEKLPRGKLVSRAAEQAVPLGVEGGQAVRITATSEKGVTLCDLSVGKATPTGRGRYVRVGSGPEIWDTAASLSPYANVQRQFWADLKVMPKDVESKDVVGVVVKSKLSLSEGKPIALGYTLSRGKGSTGAPVWSVSGAGTVSADNAKVKNLIEAVLSIEGADFDVSPNAAGKAISGAQASVELSTSGGGTIALYISPRVEGDQYPCAASGGTFAYLVPEWRVKQVLADPKTLAAETK